MVHFSDVLSQVGTETGSEDTLRSVRVNTAGWDSWLKPEPETPAPAPNSFYLDLEKLVADQDELSRDETGPNEPAAPLREEVLRSPYMGPSSTAEPTQARAYMPPVDLAHELAQARLQVMNEPELHALRRRLARRVHPDLPTADQPDAEAMVRVNVAIDNALRERRLRATRR